MDFQLFEELDIAEYQRLREEYRTEASKAQTSFLKEDFKSLRERNYPEFLKKLAEYYMVFCLFPSKQIIDKFKEATLKGDWLNWLIPIEEIEKEITKIEQTSQIIITKSYLLVLLRFHLQIKIVHALSMWQKLIVKYNNKEISITKKIFINDFRKKKYAEGTPKNYKNLADFEKHVIIDKFEKIFGRKIVKKELNNSASGNTTTILRLILLCFDRSKDFSQGDFCVAVYNFFRLIMRGENEMYSYDQYVDNAPKSYTTYRKYQVEKITKMLIKFEPEIDENGQFL